MKIVTLTLCLLLPGTGAADIYKWTDEKGQIHYGESPNGNASENIVIPRQDTQPKTPTASEKQHLENIKKWTDARQKERDKKKLEKAELKKQKAERKKQCNDLKNELADMERGGIAWYSLDEAGKRQYISDQEIESRKNDLRQTIRKNCR